MGRRSRVPLHARGAGDREVALGALDAAAVVGTPQLTPGSRVPSSPVRAEGQRHDQKKPLAGDGFRDQGRAIGHRGDLRVVRCREGQRGSKSAGRRSGWMGASGRVSRLCLFGRLGDNQSRLSQGIHAAWITRWDYSLNEHEP